jgi:hypothetical protein
MRPVSDFASGSLHHTFRCSSNLRLIVCILFFSVVTLADAEIHLVLCVCKASGRGLVLLPLFVFLFVLW